MEILSRDQAIANGVKLEINRLVGEEIRFVCEAGKSTTYAYNVGTHEHQPLCTHVYLAVRSSLWKALARPRCWTAVWCCVA